MSFNPDALVGKNIKSHPNHTGYYVERMLGQGAFGTTYKVRSLSNNQEYALKALNAVQTQQELFDFFQEALTLARLKHPNIVDFKDFGRDDREDVTFIVMALANSGSLGSRRMPLGAEYAIRYSVQAALGLQQAHDAHITHRDVKRDNLLLHRHPGKPHLDVWVTDFGIALASHSFDRLQKQNIIGSYEYMAPEHIQGKATEKSDQYSLAVITYEELTGRLPYEGNTAEVLRGHLYGNIPALGVTMTDALKAVEPVVRRGLAKEEGNRYPTIKDFGDDLERKLQEAIDASPKKHGTLFVVQLPEQPQASTLSPHELAQTLQKTEQVLPVPKKDDGSKKVKELIESSEPIWRMLRDKRFAEDANGYIRIVPEGSNEWSAGDSLDGLRIEYHPLGKKEMVVLGGIFIRYPKTKAYTGYRKTYREIDPDMPEWDTIVGTIERAINECSLKKP